MHFPIYTCKWMKDVMISVKLTKIHSFHSNSFLSFKTSIFVIEQILYFPEIQCFYKFWLCPSKPNCKKLSSSVPSAARDTRKPWFYSFFFFAEKKSCTILAIAQKTRRSTETKSIAGFLSHIVHTRPSVCVCVCVCVCVRAYVRVCVFRLLLLIENKREGAYWGRV